MIEFVSATRSTPEAFKSSTALGQSMERLAYNPTIAFRVTTGNTTGLSTLYNVAIDEDNEHDILVFLHDDVFIDDYFIGQRIIDGLNKFDVIGLAGNRRRVPRQHSWASVETEGLKFDRQYLSGMLAHGQPRGKIHISPYGPAPAACSMVFTRNVALPSSLLITRPRAASCCARPGRT